MSWSVLRTLAVQQFMKLEYSIFDLLVRFYTRAIIWCVKFFPAPLQRLLYFKLIQNFTRFAIKYYHKRVRFLEELNALETVKKLTYNFVSGRGFPAILDYHCEFFKKEISDLDLISVFLLIGDNETAQKLLSQVPVSNKKFIRIAGEYFDIDDLQSCQLILNQYIKTATSKNSRIGRVLQIENPLLSDKNNSWYDIIEVESVTSYSFSLPKIFPELLQDLPVKTVAIPAQRIFHIKQAEVFFGNVVVGDDKYLFLYEPAAQPSFDFVAGNHFYIYGSSYQLQHCFIHGEYDTVKEIDAGILLDGRCSSNYFHWIVEYLARLYTVKKIPALARLPLIVDQALAPASKQALAILAPEVPIIWNTKTTRLVVKDLYIPSFHTFHPDTLELPFWQTSAVSHDHLAFVRNAAYKHIVLNKPWRRIFIKRNGSMRTLRNSREIEQLLKTYNFEIVDPGTLSFLEQVEIFASAKCIVGAGGAAFTNLMFCQPGCVVIGLISPQLEEFCMQSNLATFAGCEFVYISGVSALPKRAFVHPAFYIHADFAVQPKKLEAALKHFLVAPQHLAANGAVELT